MRLSQYFLPILKENPSEATIVSHRLMLRAGMVRQLSSGLYNWLPLGLKVLRKIEGVVQREMDKAGALELLMPCIQPAELWQESGRYDDYGKEMLRITDRHERGLLFGPTNEEVVTDIFRQNIKSYKDLPKNLYHIQWKFRDEIRPRFGVMRGREFLMKDAYSFDIDFAGAKAAYDNMYETYLRIFKALGMSAIPVSANSGAIGGNLSHEFHIVADTGESEIFYDEKFDELAKSSTIDIAAMQGLYAAADEKHVPAECPIPAERLRSRRGIEVGHIFYFGTKYSAAMNAKVTNNQGEQVLAEMGSYGIGVSRLVGAIIEASHDERGIIWPEAVAPFKVAVINLKHGDEACTAIADSLYEQLTARAVDVLYDDTKDSAGSKFATQDLIGTPWQISIGPRGAASGTVELKERRTGEKQELSVEAALRAIG
jgi:prolyl-tRNA synthetase